MKKAITDALVQNGSLLIEAHRLPHFVALVEKAHYGKAAQRLSMNQPTLSLSIMRLENVVRVQLLVRTARSVTLTPAGEAFRKEARGLIAQAQMSSACATARLPRHSSIATF